MVAGIGIRVGIGKIQHRNTIQRELIPIDFDCGALIASLWKYVIHQVAGNKLLDVKRGRFAIYLKKK